jgi:HJR/Mrr/RecB family endonuclease
VSYYKEIAQNIRDNDIGVNYYKNQFTNSSIENFSITNESNIKINDSEREIFNKNQSIEKLNQSIITINQIIPDLNKNILDLNNNMETINYKFNKELFEFNNKINNEEEEKIYLISKLYKTKDSLLANKVKFHELLHFNILLTLKLLLNFILTFTQRRSKNIEFKQIINNAESDISNIGNSIYVLKQNIKELESQKYLKITELEQNIAHIKLKIGKYKDTIEQNIRDIKNYQENVIKLQTDILFISSQRLNGFELYHNEWLLLNEIQLRREAELGLLNNFASMTGHEFELFISELLKEMKYEIIEILKTKDYGIDIVAKNNNDVVIIQCKRYDEKNHIGNAFVRQLIGSISYHRYKASRAIFITTSYYTEPALEQAKHNNKIELWDKDTLYENIKKYLLKKNTSHILNAIENAKLKEEQLKIIKLNEIKEQQEREKERRELIKVQKEKQLKEQQEKEREKMICPVCGGGKMKTRKMCSQCKKKYHY